MNIDSTEVPMDDETVAVIISLGWTRFRMRSEGWFILRLRQCGNDRIEFLQ